MVLLIHSPAKDIHSATVKETPSPFLKLPRTDFLDVTEMYWKGPRFFRRCLMNIFGKSKYIYCESVLFENKICQYSPERRLEK